MPYHVISHVLRYFGGECPGRMFVSRMNSLLGTKNWIWFHPNTPISPTGPSKPSEWFDPRQFQRIWVQPLQRIRGRTGRVPGQSPFFRSGVQNFMSIFSVGQRGRRERAGSRWTWSRFKSPKTNVLNPKSSRPF